ncbi:elongation of very long chain fatty acids protein 7-like [Thrips palmi]|uniref:Elongation of very long chain fatty acids protein n=1 Tax=Thrips palmi TaxID=161013 RepID=A0A6P9A530_THRPL|nr:elongation of very long chain fatty acids protein 7-like [Thrips palmi]
MRPCNAPECARAVRRAAGHGQGVDVYAWPGRPAAHRLQLPVRSTPCRGTCPRRPTKLPSPPAVSHRREQHRDMEDAVNRVVEYYHESVTNYLDPRSEDWLLSRSILVPLTLIGSYLYFVKKCGPAFMANRQPYNVKSIMIVYNIIQIIANAYVFISAAQLWVSELKSITCQPIDYSVTETTRQMANLVWMYYVLKIADLIDTVLFVLRKKGSQATFLHVYHHCAMVMGGYLGCRFMLNGHVFLLGVINAFVHTVLYSYYLLAALRPETREASWKKYITVLQLVQFVILFVHNIFPLVTPDCHIQKIWSVILVVQNVFMFAMFSDFYAKAYCSKKKKQA